jgi:hypothetical protein
MGLIWVAVYALIALAVPGSFRYQGAPMVRWVDDTSRRAEFLRLVIFSYSRLTSSGVGDLQTASGFASVCANLEALSAQVYLAVVIARLVGLQAAAPVPTPRPGPRPVERVVEADGAAQATRNGPEGSRCAESGADDERTT